MTFEEQLSWGQVGEHVIERWLIRRGWHILPVYNGVTDKGPRMLSPDRQVILPDLLIFRRGETRWVEAKRKSMFSWHRRNRYWCTGIDQHVFRDYQAVEQRTGFPVYLLFLQEPGVDPYRGEVAPSGLYGGELSYLAQVWDPQSTIGHIYNGYGKSGMLYWKEQALSRLAAYTDVVTPLPS